MISVPQAIVEKPLRQFDANGADGDKTNPFHGIIALMLQSKNGESHCSTPAPRGPGRPSLIDVSVDENETEEQVKTDFRFTHAATK